MSWLHGWSTRLRLLLDREASESRFDRELQFHVDMESERLVREDGLPPDEARRRALALLGGMESHREALRDGRGVAWFTGWALDLKLGLRMMWKYPGLTLVGVLGISVAVAIGVIAFTAVETVTSTSLPIPEGNRVVAITNIDLRNNDEGRRTHLHDLATWREDLTTVRDVSAWRSVNRNVIVAGLAPIPQRVAEMSATGFRLTRTPAFRGRYLIDDDELPAAPLVAVVGHAFWQRQLGGRPDVVGLTVQIGRTAHTVVGVMPPGFAFPLNNQVWIPLRIDPLSWKRGEAPPLDVFGRLASGISLAEARVHLRTIGDRLSAEFPDTHADIRPRIQPYTRSFLDTPGSARLLHLGQVLVSLLLVIIGINVAVLVYARTASRGGELAVRTALGAGRRRLVAQLFAEALVLSGTASVLGVLTARMVFARIETLIRNSADDQVPYWMHLQVSPAVAVYAAGLAILAAVIIGVIPGLKATRHRVSDHLRNLSGGSPMQLGRGWSALLIIQVAVSVGALPIALVGGVSWVGLALTDVRTPATAAVVMAMPLLDREDAADENRQARYVARVDELVRRLEGAGVGFGVVRMGYDPGTEARVPVEIDRVPDEDLPDSLAVRSGISVATNPIDSTFFTMFDVRILAGRRFSAADFVTGSRAVIVNRAFARYFFADGNALGRRFHASRTAAAGEPAAPPVPAWEIVGVVADFPAHLGRGNVLPGFYRPLDAMAVDPLWLAVRARGLSPLEAGERIRSVAAGIDPAIRFRPIRALDDLFVDALRVQRLGLLGLVSVTLSVVLLSAACIYALMSFTVTRRRREIGIRCALGATRNRILSSVLARAVRQVGIGIVIGTGLTGLLAFLSSDFGAVVSDTTSRIVRVGTLAGQVLAVGLAMAVVSLLASLGPARRALRVQPSEVLKSE